MWLNWRAHFTRTAANAVCVCVHACVRACVHACVRMCGFKPFSKAKKYMNSTSLTESSVVQENTGLTHIFSQSDSQLLKSKIKYLLCTTIKLFNSNVLKQTKEHNTLQQIETLKLCLVKSIESHWHRPSCFLSKLY